MKTPPVRACRLSIVASKIVCCSIFNVGIPVVGYELVVDSFHLLSKVERRLSYSELLWWAGGCLTESLRSFTASF